MIKVVPYDSDWPNIFETEAIKLREIFGDLIVDVHHIGSTSIPNMWAKPIIDMIPVVTDICKVDSYNDAMRSAGYEVEGEFGILFRRYFQKESDGIRTHNIHIYEIGNDEIDRHLSFRDYLRTNSEEAKAYALLKQKLALQFANDTMSYINGKEDFIHEIDKKSGTSEPRIMQAFSDKELQAVKNYRQKYFFDKVPMDDPYLWTFDHKDHQHFVLYHDTNIIGYAHIQLWPEHRAGMRIIVIDEDKRGSGIGRWFMKKIEGGLKESGFTSLHAESNPGALSFYTVLGYTPMPFDDPGGDECGAPDISVGKIL